MIKETSIRSLISDESWQEISTAGRVISFSRLGNIAFGKIADSTGSIQFALKKNVLGDSYKGICTSIVRGIHIHIVGDRWITQTGELTILVKTLNINQSSRTALPDKWDGLENQETIYRKRYMVTSTDSEAANIFRLRSNVISSIRSFLNNKDFLEVETPILTQQASGAIAKPFITHHNALDKDLYLRIAPEVFLKMMTAGGFDNVYEIGKSFRNEGIDRSHIQEFTSLEFYRAYADYQDNKVLFLEMLENIFFNCKINQEKVIWCDNELNFSNIKTVKYRDLFSERWLPSPDELTASDADEIFKKQIRPNIIQPTIVEDYPSHMSPMAKRKDDDSSTVEQWQLIVCGWEIVKCYSELVDPIVQRKILEEQMSMREHGDEEAMMIDEAFIEAMEYGMPTQSGVGVGIDRLVAILANKSNLRDVVYFPMLG